MPDLFSPRSRTLGSRVVGIVLVAYVLSHAPPKYFPDWLVGVCESIGLVLLAAAAFGRLWCLVFIAGQKNNAVVTDGPYSMVRNPLYVFSFLGAVGFGLSVENPLLAVLLAAAFGIYYSVVVRKEEQYLSAAFGVTYQNYVASTPRWLPRFSQYHEPPLVSVDPVKMRRGILDAMWFIWAYLLWEIAESVQELLAWGAER